MEFYNILKHGDRKEIGKSKDVAQSILGKPSLLRSLFKVLRDHSDDNTVVSHGFYALKEASLVNLNIQKKVIEFCKADLEQFSQWEAKENFLRVCLVDMRDDRELFQMVVPLAEDVSAIVQSYAAEYLIRFLHKFDNSQLKKQLKRLETLAGRASMKARIRKIKKELSL